MNCTGPRVFEWVPAKKKNLEKILKNIPGIFPVSGVAEQIGNRDHLLKSLWSLSDPLPEVKRVLPRLTGNP
jgi:hypothetical protein